MKKTNVLSLIAFVFAIAFAVAFTPAPPPGQAYGKISAQDGCALGTLSSESCNQTSGVQCSVTIGSPPTQVTRPAYFSVSGCDNQTEGDRVMRPNN